MRLPIVAALALFLVAGRVAAQDVPSLEDTVAALAKLNKPVLGPDAPERKVRATALRSLRDEANQRDRAAWAAITSKEAWEKYRDETVALLRRSLGTFPEPPKQVKVMTTKTIDGDGFRIENLVFESRPGLVVSANLYVPAKRQAAMPGIVIIHSHHNPKTQGELQDMGMTWARAGCLVLVPDMLGHGERRQHPFATEKDYPAPFKVSRQDYYFRYNLGVQLQLAGESLIGWMVWDLMRGIDVLLVRPGIDRDKIIVLGSVAGGGDPAAVLTALDPRVAAVVPFNFGGAQPETKFPLPADAEASFNYMGGGSWESTRNLRNSARDGFLPWLIVAAAAPRPLIYAHEFAWDRERDPVWKRFQKIWGFYGAMDKLAALNGRGSVSGKPPEATHCNNIGAEHRKGIHPAFEKWFGIKATKYQARLPASALQCLDAEAKELFKPRPVCELIDDLVRIRLDKARALRAHFTIKQQRKALRSAWDQGLGFQRPLALRAGNPGVAEGRWLDHYWYKTFLVEGHPINPLAVPTLWLQPASIRSGTPVVVGVAQGGKAGFLKHRPQVVARLLREGISVCLPDLRGTGEWRGSDRGCGRTASDTARSATYWMHGQTNLAWQVQELDCVLSALRTDGAGPIILWGDSFAPVNGPEARLAIPDDADAFPKCGEPVGALVTLLDGLYAEKNVNTTIRGIFLSGGLASYRSALVDTFFYLPHDAFAPGMLTKSDLDDVAAVLAPRPLHIEAMIDAHNRRLNSKQLDAEFALTRAAYAGKAGLELRSEPSSPEEVAAWLVKVAKGAGR